VEKARAVEVRRERKRGVGLRAGMAIVVVIWDLGLGLRALEAIKLLRCVKVLGWAKIIIISLARDTSRRRII